MKEMNNQIFSKKRNFVYLIILFIILSTQYASNIGFSQKFEKQKINVNSTNNTISFHGNISESKFWYAIKANFSNFTNVTIDSKIDLLSKNNSTNARASFLCCINTNPNKGYDYTLFVPSAYPSDKDYYLQIHLGRFNWSFYHIDRNGPYAEFQSHGKESLHNLSGIYYFIFAAYGVKCSLDFWINTTKETIFSSDYGKESFFYQREDFISNLNVGWKRGTIIINGEKEIDVDNLLFAWFIPHETTGLEMLRYSNNDNQTQWKFKGDISSRPIFDYSSKYFDRQLLGGLAGKWIFKTTMINRAKYSLYPNIYLFGADVRLPK
jgi:hypothetical protein